MSLRDLRLLPVSRQGPFQVRTCHRDINILDKKLLIRSSIRQLVDYRLHNRSRDIQNITLQFVKCHYIILSLRLGPQDGAERHRGLALLPRHDGAGQPGGRQARPGAADHGRGPVSQTSVMLSVYCLFARSLWQQKKREDDDMSYREREEAKEYSKMRMFGRCA